jgi:LmbE family N-acetylglucosaminyl deacetylase
VSADDIDDSTRHGTNMTHRHIPRPRPLLLAAIALLLPALAGPASAQVPLDRGFVGTALDLRGLDGLKRVLLVGAHPDDEDTALLTTLARGEGAETAYLSVTRGDGGQNLIGPQLGEGLGAIRTGELLAARELDGGVQFFTRAIDFGYSKTAEETIEKWEEDEVLRDIVMVIRRFRPHVIVSVWQGNASDGHGHHQASGLLTKEAFDVAADPERFRELEDIGLEAWATPKLYLLNRRSDETDTEVATGTYDLVLGRSHHQLAMDSRSQHRSQDMGSSQPFGQRSSRLLLEGIHTSDGTRVQITDVQRAPSSGVDPAATFFAGVDTTLAGPAAVLDLPRADEIAQEIARYRGYLMDARRYFGAGQAVEAVQALAEARMPLESAITVVGTAAGQQLPGARAYLTDLLRRADAVERTLLSMTGVVTRVQVDDDLIVPGESVDVVVEVWNGGGFGISRLGTSLRVPGGWDVAGPRVSGRIRESSGPGGGTEGISAAAGEVVRFTYTVTPPKTADLSRLYYRETPGTDAMYAWPEDEPLLWGLPKAPRPISAEIAVTFLEEYNRGWEEREGVPLRTPAISTTVAGEYVGVDQADGEFTHPPLVVPAISVTAEPGSLVWPSGPDGVPAEAKQVTVRLENFAEAGRRTTVGLEVGDGWAVNPRNHSFDFDAPGQQATFTFNVIPQRVEPGRHTFRVRAVALDPASAGQDILEADTYTEGFSLLDYPHIERMAFFEPAEINVSVVPVRADDVSVGYIFGPGDDGMLALRQMGIDVREVTAEDLRNGNLDDLDVLMLGIRVYETQPEIAALSDRILAFAEAGGTVVTQYNQYNFPRGEYAPYPVDISRPHDRTTDEFSPVEFIHPTSPVFQGPNTLTLDDFEGWVQERGLYYLGEWDDRYVPQIRFRDPGEDWEEGALVVAPYGAGLYVYTGISFFRQFPAGVAGAYRLFANLVSLDRASWDAWADSMNEEHDR